MIIEKALGFLACPTCRKSLSYHITAESEHFTCNSCFTPFEIREGIPILTTDFNKYSSSQDKDFEVNFMTEEMKKSDYAGYDRGVYAALKEREYRELFNMTIPCPQNSRLLLDFGCGVGLSSIILGDYGYNIVGMDIVFEGLRQMKSILTTHDVEPFLVVGDGEHTPFLDNSFDVVFIGGVLHHFPDYTETLGECHRILKPHGQLIAIEPNRLDLPSTLKFILWRKSGLQSINEDTLNPFRFMRKMKTLFHDTHLLYPGINHTRYIKSDTPKKKVVAFLRDCFYAITPDACSNQFFVATGVKNDINCSSMLLPPMVGLIPQDSPI